MRNCLTWKRLRGTKFNTFRVQFRLAVIRYGVLRVKSSLDLCFHSDKTPLQKLRAIRLGNSTDLLGYSRVVGYTEVQKKRGSRRFVSTFTVESKNQADSIPQLAAP